MITRLVPERDREGEEGAEGLVLTYSTISYISNIPAL